MTPSILKNVIRIPKKRSQQVRTRISYMTSEQLQRFLAAAKEYGPREHAMFLFAVAHGALPGWTDGSQTGCRRSGGHRCDADRAGPRDAQPG